MADAATEEEGPPPKRLGKALLIGLVLAVPAGAGGYFAAASGLLGGGADGAEEKAAEPADAGIAFVPIEPIVVSVGTGTAGRHLRFNAQLEVPNGKVRDVTALMPRITDVLNGYLRAVEARDLEEPSALIKLRAQMLRRVRLVVGEDNVRDLLVMEFVLN
ncbi:MAG: flagellar basal body-associated FliL family protein [Pseudomonadota bacterium]